MKAINCVQVGIIQGFDAATQSATIQLAIKKVVNIALDGTRTLQEYPVLLQCPVMILSGGASHLTFPIAAGDTCIVLFNDREIDNWYFSGGVQAPTSGRLHDKSDAIAIVGIRNTQNAIAGYFNGTQLQHDADTKIEFTPDHIKMTADTVEITGNLILDGVATGNGGTINIGSNIVQSSGHSIHAGNGASGTFDHVTVIDGIVVGGS